MIKVSRQDGATVNVRVWDPRVEAWLFDITETHHVHILPMIVNHRVVLTPKDDLRCYDAGWCYASEDAAFAACEEWRRREFDGEPSDYTKRAI